MNTSNKMRISIMKNKTFRRHAKSVFLKSYIQSVSNIVGAKTWRVRILEFTMFALCLTGMAYNILSYIELYRTYSTVTNEIVTKPQYLEQPAITFCNLNRIPRQLACEYGELRCIPKNRSEFCTERTRSCPDHGEPYLKVKSGGVVRYKATDKFSWDLLTKQEHPCTITSCSISLRNVTVPCEKHILLNWTNIEAHPVVCCTIFSAWNNIQKASQRIDKKAIIKFTLNTYPEEYISGGEHPSVYVSIHNRKTFRNPLADNGYQLKGGRKYLARVSKLTEVQSLPPPYDTKCRNYTKAWFANNGTGPITEQDCQEQCKIKYYLEGGVLEKQQCIRENILFPHTLPVCRKVTIERFLSRASTRECHNSCEAPCLERKYDVTYFDEGVYACDGSGSSDHSDWCLASNISFTVSFEFLNLKKITYTPQFQDIEFFSNIGGFMGMWIGIALVDIIDFLLSLGKLIIYPWTHRRRAPIQKPFAFKKQHAFISKHF